MVIEDSSAADWYSPAEACSVACDTGLEVPAFDIASACVLRRAGAEEPC